MSFVAVGVGGAAMIAGAAMSAGKKMKVPEIAKVSPEEEQKKAIEQNIAALEPATKLAEKTTAAEQGILEQQLRKAIPNYDQMVSQIGKNIGAGLKGELSADVLGQVQRSAAGRALSGGYGPGTSAGRALTARDIGLTSTQLQQQSLGQAMDFMRQQRTIGMVQPFSVASMFVSPSQRIDLAFRENQAMFGRDVMAAQVAAQPDPMMAAIGGSISNMGGIAFGGGMGKLMGGGGSSQQQQQPSPMIMNYQPQPYSSYGVSYNMYQPQQPIYGGYSGNYGSNNMLSMMYAPPPQTGGYAQSIWGGP